MWLALPLLLLLIGIVVLLAADEEQPGAGRRGEVSREGGGDVGDEGDRGVAQAQEQGDPATAPPGGGKRGTATTSAAGALSGTATTGAGGATSAATTTPVAGSAPGENTTPSPAPGAAGTPTPSPAGARSSAQVTELSGSSPGSTLFSLDPEATSFTVAWDMKGPDTNSVSLSDVPERRNPVEVVTTTGPTKGEKTYPPAGASGYLLYVDGRKEWKVTITQHFG